jgi:high-affinity iron transporter
VLASGLIGFREALEAAIIISIILTFIYKTKAYKLQKYVWLGVGSATLSSIAVAILFNSIAEGFTGDAEAIFEGFAMILAAIILTYVVIWIQKAHELKKQLKEHKGSIFAISFISVFREGVETVIFLAAARFAGDGSNNLLGALIGILLAILVGYFIIQGGKHLQLKKFFKVTSILLIFFAAGLLAHGVHEFQEVGWIPIIYEHVWDINPEVNLDGSYPLLHENGAIGALGKGLFGYNGNPNLLEVLIWLTYLGIMLSYKNKIGVRKE